MNNLSRGVNRSYDMMSANMAYGAFGAPPINYQAFRY